MPHRKNRSSKAELDLHEQVALGWVREGPGQSFGLQRPTELSIKQFRDRFARGGYWWTMSVNQSFGALIARAAVAAGLRPVHLSLLNIAVGVATSAWLLFLQGSLPLAAACTGILGWQLAYSLDCADGQVARATGRSSPAGAVLDLLGDFFVQITVVFTMLQIGTADMAPSWVSGFSVFVAGGWLISPYYGGILGLHEVPVGTPELRSVKGVVRQARDYGFHVALLPLATLVSPWSVATILAVIAALNFLSLFLGINLHGRTKR
ncbi:hypothetical protein BH24ACT26_BH24ACT26_13320 [soil metagenome]